MDYEKESKKIINKQKKNFPQINKKQQEIIKGNLYQNLNNVEYVTHKGENICQTEMKY